MPPYPHWLQDAHTRLHPTAITSTVTSYTLDAARGESVAFQAALSHGDPSSKEQVIAVRARVQAPDTLEVRLRRVGHVPQRHHSTAIPTNYLDSVGHVPGYVPDPLYDECEVALPLGETASFWITVGIPRDCPPGNHVVEVLLRAGEQEMAPLVATITVYDVVVQPRRNFPVIQWFYNDAILDWYKLTAFEEAFWQRVEPYMRNLPGHGQDTIYAPVFTPPLDGVKRPTQLLRVHRRDTDLYAFDWQDVKRYVDLARRCGIRNFEWTHFFTQWGVAHAIRIYEGQGVDEKLLWDPETGATSDTYRRFLEQFMPEFKGFLEREELVDRSFFHVSDEPHGEAHRANYRAARQLLREVAPWMKTMDALSEIEYGRQGLTDQPVPSIAVTKQFVDEGIPCYTYFCCGPRGAYLQRLMDTPLLNTRMAGWLFYKFQVLGFLHWGYNYWYRSQTRTLIDPFTESSGDKWPGWTYGDPFVVYPGPDGPLDSIRWEIFAQSLQDYALLQTLGVDPGHESLADFRDFNDFPRTLKWLTQTRRQLLTGTLP